MIPTDLKKLIRKYDPATGSFVVIHDHGYWFDGKNFIDWPIVMKSEIGRNYKFYKGFLMASFDFGQIKLFRLKKRTILFHISAWSHFLYTWSFNYVQFEQYLYKFNIYTETTKLNLKGQTIESLPTKKNPGTGYRSLLKKGIIYRLGSEIHEKYEIKTKKWTQIESKSLRDVFELGSTKRIFGIASEGLFELMGDKWVNTHITLPK